MNDIHLPDPLPVRAPDPVRADIPARAGQSAGGPGPSHGLRAWTVSEVEDLVRHHAEVAGISADLALAIASCESGLRWDAKNPTSSASGVFQYLSGTWANTAEGRKGTSVFDADANIRMAVGHIAVHGASPWNSSKQCWSK